MFKHLSIVNLIHLLSIISILCFAEKTFSQNDTKFDTIYNLKTITFYPHRLFTGELIISYDHSFFPKYSLGGQIGILKSIDNGLQNVPNGSPRFIHDGIILGFTNRYYFHLKNRFFVESGFRYKYKSAENERFSNHNASPTYKKHIYIDQVLEVYNANIIVGKQKIVKYFVFEFYLGVGVNLTYATTDYLGCSFGSDNGIQEACLELMGGIGESEKPDYDNGRYLAPTIHGGIKIGIGFYENNY